eukprot:TRINITY_DN2762_c0_g1_i6.p1 TRINITY_DN2762_c0_g1~~TRINITY_DN2762_c0_g1_i6.p1  ORF type:complete len:538 (-),score=96.22 TRINITY_DN2762_c0_g1_i6:152-1765(-)
MIEREYLYGKLLPCALAFLICFTALEPKPFIPRSVLVLVVLAGTLLYLAYIWPSLLSAPKFFTKKLDRTLSNDFAKRLAEQEQTFRTQTTYTNRLVNPIEKSPQIQPFNIASTKLSQPSPRLESSTPITYSRREDPRISDQRRASPKDIRDIKWNFCGADNGKRSRQGRFRDSYSPSSPYMDHRHSPMRNSPYLIRNENDLSPMIGSMSQRSYADKLARDQKSSQGGYVPRGNAELTDQQARFDAEAESLLATENVKYNHGRWISNCHTWIFHFLVPSVLKRDKDNLKELDMLLGEYFGVTLKEMDDIAYLDQSIGGISVGMPTSSYQSTQSSLVMRTSVTSFKKLTLLDILNYTSNTPMDLVRHLPLKKTTAKNTELNEKLTRLIPERVNIEKYFKSAGIATSSCRKHVVEQLHFLEKDKGNKIKYGEEAKRGYSYSLPSDTQILAHLIFTYLNESTITTAKSKGVRVSVQRLERNIVIESEMVSGADPNEIFFVLRKMNSLISEPHFDLLVKGQLKRILSVIFLYHLVSKIKRVR